MEDKIIFCKINGRFGDRASRMRISGELDLSAASKDTLIRKSTRQISTLRKRDCAKKIHRASLVRVLRRDCMQRDRTLYRIMEVTGQMADAFPCTSHSATKTTLWM